MEVTCIAVVGAGTMGASIAVALASHGYQVILKEVNEDFLARGLENIERIQKKRVARGTAQETLD